MPATNAKTEPGGFTAEERAAMKKRAAELRAEGKKGARKADGLQAVLDSIAAMALEDRALAERVHVMVTATAPGLSPKTWYGMPAYANADGKVVVFFHDAGKFSCRYSTLGFQDAANLDDGDVAGGVRAEHVEPHGGEEGRRARDGRDLLTGAATAAERPHRPPVQRLGTPPRQPRCHDLPCLRRAPRGHAGRLCRTTRRVPAGASG